MHFWLLVVVRKAVVCRNERNPWELVPEWERIALHIRPMLWDVQRNRPENVVIGQASLIRLGFCGEDANQFWSDDSGIVEHNEDVLHRPCPLYLFPFVLADDPIEVFLFL